MEIDKKIELMEKDLQGIRREVAEIGNKVGQMFTALMGSDLAKDGGLVERIKKLEQENDKLKIKLDEADEKESENKFFVKWMRWAVSIIVSGVLLWILTAFFHLIKV